MLQAKISTKTRKIVKLYEKEPKNTQNEYVVLPEGETKLRIYRAYLSDKFNKVFFLLEKDEETLYSYTPNNQFQQALIEMFHQHDFTNAYIIINKKTEKDYITITLDFENLTIKESIDDDIISQII
mgnify:CR=1 FL=1